MLHDYCGEVRSDSISTQMNKQEQTVSTVPVDSRSQTYIPPVIADTSSSQTASLSKNYRVQADFIYEVHVCDGLTRQRIHCHYI